MGNGMPDLWCSHKFQSMLRALPNLGIPFIKEGTRVLYFANATVEGFRTVGCNGDHVFIGRYDFDMAEVYEIPQFFDFVS
jgi:hypothetical protein